MEHPNLSTDTATTLNPRRKLVTSDGIHAGLHAAERAAINDLATFVLDEAGSAREVVVAMHNDPVTVTSTDPAVVHASLAVAFTVTTRPVWIEVWFPAVLNASGTTYLGVEVTVGGVTDPDLKGLTAIGAGVLSGLRSTWRHSTPGEIVIRPMMYVTAGTAVVNASDDGPLIVVVREA